MPGEVVTRLENQGKHLRQLDIRLGEIIKRLDDIDNRLIDLEARHLDDE